MLDCVHSVRVKPQLNNVCVESQYNIIGAEIGRVYCLKPTWLLSIITLPHASAWKLVVIAGNPQPQCLLLVLYFIITGDDLDLIPGFVLKPTALVLCKALLTYYKLVVRTE